MGVTIHYAIKVSDERQARLVAETNKMVVELAKSKPILQLSCGYDEGNGEPNRVGEIGRDFHYVNAEGCETLMLTPDEQWCRTEKDGAYRSFAKTQFGEARIGQHMVYCLILLHWLRDMESDYPELVRANKKLYGLQMERIKFAEEYFGKGGKGYEAFWAAVEPLDAKIERAKKAVKKCPEYVYVSDEADVFAELYIGHKVNADKLAKAFGDLDTMILGMRGQLEGLGYNPDQCIIGGVDIENATEKPWEGDKKEITEAMVDSLPLTPKFG